MIRSRSYWWASVSLTLMIVGAVSPWAETHGVRADGHQDEVVLVLAIVGCLILVLLAVSGRWWLGAIPLLAGLAAALLTGNAIRDIRDLVPSANDRHASLEWGIYLALFGSTNLVLSLVPLLVEKSRAARSRRLRQARQRDLARPARRWAFAARSGSESLGGPALGEPLSGEAAEPPSQKEFVGLAKDYTPYVVSDLPRRRLIVPTGDRRLSKLFWTRTNDDSALARALATLAQAGIGVRGTTFLDVGANIGQTTLAALRAGFGSVLAFEPVVETFQLLRANLALNGVEDRVRTLQVALSDRSGSETIVLTPGKLGSAHLPVRAGGESEHPRESVTLARLDDLVSDGTLDPGSIGLLWIDTEGHEAQVLGGAEQTLAHGFPVVAELNAGLGGADRLDDVATLLRERFTCFLDLRRKGAKVFGADELDGLIETLCRQRRVTDVLAFDGPAAVSGRNP